MKHGIIKNHFSRKKRGSIEKKYTKIDPNPSCSECSKYEKRNPAFRASDDDDDFPLPAGREKSMMRVSTLFIDTQVRRMAEHNRTHYRRPYRLHDSSLRRSGNRLSLAPLVGAHTSADSRHTFSTPHPLVSWLAQRGHGRSFRNTGVYRFRRRLPLREVLHLGRRRKAGRGQVGSP